MPDRSNRVLMVIATVTIALIAIATALMSTKQTKELSADSPEGVVQLYLKSVIDKKNDQAAGYFIPDSTCTASDLDRAYIATNVSASLNSTEVSNTRAYVKISILFGSGGPFDSGYTEQQTFRLERANGLWRIAGIPWPLYDCGVVKK